MKLSSRIFLLLSITVFLIGCKLAVIVVEGGEVQSTGSGTCLASTICIVDVTDPNFAETFTAVPNTGWYFQKWNLGSRFFCGDSTNPTCTLSFQGYEETEEVEDVVASSETFYLMPVFKSSKITSVDGRVSVDGKQWLQPIDFINYSYHQVSAVCPGGVCSGTLPGSAFDLTGYTWASIDDANALFAAYREEGRSILGDFTYTTYDRSTKIVYAMLSALPLVDPDYPDSKIYLASVFGEGPPYDAAQEFSNVSAFPISPEERLDSDGPWFWK